MKINFLVLLFITGLSVTFFSSCETKSNRIDEGVVVYDISYPIPFEDKWMERLMPKEMEMQFKDDMLKTELSFGLGMIKIAYLSDKKKEQLFEMLKFMKKKNFSTLNKKDITAMMQTIAAHKITPGTSTKMIAGYTCKNAYVEVKDDTTSYEFECWYTDELGSEDINWCSPFLPIKGVLMEYQIERFDVAMKFVATEVRLVEIPDENFVIPDKYKEISSEEMEENLQQLKDI